MTDDEPDLYDEQVQTLRTRIIEAKVLRDAQAADSANCARFQGEIDTMTRRLFAIQDRAPALRKLDQRVVNASYAVQCADRDLTQFRPGRFVRCILMVLFGLFLLVMAVSSWGTIAGVVGLAMLAIGGFAAWTMVRRRSLLLDDRHQAITAMRAAGDERDKLINNAPMVPATVSSRPAPGQAPGVFANAISNPPAQS
jgi:hypothetical protein